MQENNQQLSPGQAQLAAITTNRGTLKLNDSAHNDAYIDSLMPKKAINSSRGANNRNNETTGIGQGLGKRKQSFGSLSQVPNSRSKKQQNNQINRSMN